MVSGLWLDVLFFLPLSVIPLPYAWHEFGWPVALLWINVVILGFSALTRFGCARCPFTFCPIGKAARVFCYGGWKARPYIIYRWLTGQEQQEPSSESQPLPQPPPQLPQPPTPSSRLDVILNPQSL